MGTSELFILNENGMFENVNNFQYELTLQDLTTDKVFKKYIKNDYFLEEFKRKVKHSKKITILHVKDLWRM